MRRKFGEDNRVSFFFFVGCHLDGILFRRVKMWKLGKIVGFHFSFFWNFPIGFLLEIFTSFLVGRRCFGSGDPTQER